MHAAPFSKENVPSSCVYSAQGNLVCQKMANSDPVIPMSPYSCSSKPAVVEKYMDLNFQSMANKAKQVLGMPSTDGYEDPNFEKMMKQAQDALKTMQSGTKEGYQDAEFEKMMQELQKMQAGKEGYMDYNIDELMKKVKSVVAPSQPKTEKYMDFSVNGMMDQAKGFLGMAPPPKKAGAEMFHANGSRGIQGHSPAETAMNMSYSVSPWPF